MLKKALSNSTFLTSARFCTPLLIALSFTFLTACFSNKTLQYDSAALSTISGSVENIGSMSVQAMACTVPTVSLFLLDSAGAKSGAAIDTTTVSPTDGSFRFEDVKSKGVDFNSDVVKYSLELNGCSEPLSRPVTGKKEQMISKASTLLDWVALVNDPSKTNLSELDKSQVDSLLVRMAAVSGSSVFQVHSNALVVGTVTNQFQNLFGIPLSELLAAAPQIQEITSVNSVAELSGANFSVSASHLDPSYDLQVVWKLDGVQVSISNNYTYTPTQNSQGLHTIQLFVGHDNGANQIDLTKSYVTKSFALTVADTYPATVPNLTLTSNALTNDPNIVLSLNTGVALANCESFSSLALTEDSVLAPVSPVAYTITCNNPVSQTINYTLSDTTTQGSRTLRLWAMDASGNISLLPQSVTLTFDNQAPVLSSVLVNDGAAYAGTSILSVKVGLSDNLTSLPKVRLALANLGTSSCQSEYQDNSWQSWVNASTNILLSISPFDGTKKICVWGKDDAGNISVINGLGTAGTDFDDIQFQTGNIPSLTKFEVKRTSDNALTGITLGQPLTITWSASDVEGLDNNPISIAYTTNNSLWKDIVTNQDVTNPANMTWLGGLSGNPTTISDQTIASFNSPAASGTSPFRLRAVIRDGVGNYSVMTNSQILNMGSWSVYAGTKDRGDGGSGRSAALYGTFAGKIVAISPINGDIFAIDTGYGLRKLDVKTGLVSTVIGQGTLNLPDDGALPVAPRIPLNSYSSVAFDRNGRMYISTSDTTYAGKIYQIDFSTNHVRRYTGGGSADDEGNTSQQVNVATQAIQFDEQNSMYFATWCGGGPISEAERVAKGKRILKLTQNSDGTPGTIGRLIGDCTNANPSVFGGLAKSAPASAAGYPSFIGITPIGNGDVVYIVPYANGLIYKIVNGILYSVSPTVSNGVLGGGYSGSGFMTYNPQDGKIYKSNTTGGIDRFTPNSSGNGGESVETYFAGNSAVVGCNNDNAQLPDVCTTIGAQILFSGGVSYFVDKIGINSEGGYQVRFIDNQGKLGTVFGSPKFYGDGLQKNLIRGSISGIFYKSAADYPSQTVNAQANFPEGLYFLDFGAMTFNYVDPATQMVSTLFGNQDNKSNYVANGTVVSKHVSMGRAYFGGAGRPLIFDESGLPWMRVNMNYLLSLDDQKRAVQRTASSAPSSLFSTYEVNSGNPANYTLAVSAGMLNFALKNNTMFYIGGYAVGYDPVVKILAADYAGNTITKTFGGSSPRSTAGNGISADNSTPGSAQGLSLYDYCVDNISCFIQYNSSDDSLYFGEDNKIRFITTPTNTATSTLGTIVTLASGAVSNFSFNKDHSQLWYFASSNKLICYDISSGKSWCDNATNYYPNSTFASIAIGANQITFKDNSTMFVSTYSGEILEFKLPTGP